MTTGREAFTLLDGPYFLTRDQRDSWCMQPYSQEPLYIDLDDPVPRWFRSCGVVAAILVAALMIAPWAIDLEAQPTPAEGQTPQTQTREYAAICQPTVDFPAFAEPAVSMALPSWMRLCDWFADPVVAHPVNIPTQPATGPHFTD